MKKVLQFVFLCFLPVIAGAQNINDIMLEPGIKGQSVMATIARIEEQNQVKFFFKKDWLEGIDQSNIKYPVKLSEFLDITFSGAGLTYIIREKNIILFQENYKAVNLEKSYSKSEEVKVVGNDNVPLDKKIQVTGLIQDGQENGSLPGAVIRVLEINDGAVANAEGKFSFFLYPGLYTFKVNFVGFEETISKVFVKSGGNIDFTLFESSLQLAAVTIEEFAIDQNVNSAQVSVTNLDMKTIKSIPMFLGEADVVKSVLLLPGVSVVGEGSTGFNVRGGGADQNLLIFDKTPIFNPSHLFGFFTNINPDAVKDVTFYKGGIPARFGGRASSVLEINSRNPEMEDFKLKGGVGLITSRLTADIPLVKNKSSLLLGGRASYINWLLNQVNNLEIQRSRAQFYDVNGKWVTKLGDKDLISVSGYISQDEFKFAADTTYGWQTKNINASWVRSFNDQLSAEISAVSANYSYDVNGEIPRSQFILDSNISNQILSGSLFYNPGQSHRIAAGYSYGRYQFNLGELTPTSTESSVIPITIPDEQAIEQAIYIQDDYKINEKVSIAAGLRFSSFSNVGPKEVFLYSDTETRSEESVTGTQEFKKGETIKKYSGLEPRFSMKYSINTISSLKMGYNRTRQYIHTISNTSSITPIDIWKPSDTYLAPKIADQISVGYFRNMKDNELESSVEIYYKELQNEIDYKNGARILLNKNLERDIISGRGRSYGAEFYLKKNTGRFTGWMSYTLSRTEKQIIGNFEEELINEGKYYAAEYDKPHNLSIVGDYKLSNRWKVNGNFTYSSGRPFTGPDVKFRYNGNVLTYFANRNQQRIPNYHRLDLSITLEPGFKKGRVLDGSWTLSFYNVYGRENAYSVYIGERSTSAPVAYKFSILGSVFPSLSYNFEL